MPDLWLWQTSGAAALAGTAEENEIRNNVFAPNKPLQTAADSCLNFLSYFEVFISLLFCHLPMLSLT